MTPEDIERVDEALRYGGVEELRAEVRAALERANDVGTLDAFLADGGSLDFACVDDKLDLRLSVRRAKAINNGQVG